METWKAIPGFEAYEASTLGRIRRGERILSLGRNNVTGYLQVSLYRNDKTTQRGAHRFIALAFHGPCPEGCEVHHVDENKRNNSPSNLMYVTRSQNLRASGRYGDTHERAVLDAVKVASIRSLYKPFSYSRPRLAKEFGVSVRTIDSVIDRRGRFA